MPFMTYLLTHLLIVCERRGQLAEGRARDRSKHQGAQQCRAHSSPVDVDRSSGPPVLHIASCAQRHTTLVAAASIESLPNFSSA